MKKLQFVKVLFFDTKPSAIFILTLGKHENFMIGLSIGSLDIVVVKLALPYFFNILNHSISFKKVS